MPGLSTTTRVPLGGRPFGGRPFGEVAVQADAAVVGPAFGELVAVRESGDGIVRVGAEVAEEVGHWPVPCPPVNVGAPSRIRFSMDAPTCRIIGCAGSYPSLVTM